MKKASAIVTDGGGMLSHAAIVARELKIPCVVGTKIATQVLNNGDVVEVDAEKGVVRLLERKISATSGAPTFSRRAYEFAWGNIQTMQTIENNVTRIVKYPEDPWNFIAYLIEFARANQIQTYQSAEDMGRGREVGKMFLDEKGYTTFISRMEKDIADTWTYYGRLRTTPIRNLSDHQLIDVFNEAQDHWQKVIAHFGPTQPEGIHALVEKIKEFVTTEELQVLLLSKELDEVNKEAIDWWKLLQKPISKDVLLEHAYKYPWMAAMHFSYDDVIQTLTARYDFDKKHASKPLIEEEKKALKREHEAICSTHPNVRIYAERAQRLSLSRMEVKAAWAGVDFYLIPVIDEIAKRTGESITDINLYYRIGEVGELLLNKKKLAQATKDARKQCFVGTIQDGVMYYFEGDAAEKVVRDVLGEDFQQKERSAQVKGTVAQPGTVKGTVRILHANDIIRSRELRTSFKKGEILVTEMTQPNIMDIASKAGAIVTDEGSLLSHAAIISREFQIPCIVGTGNATKALQDDDVVEVNANNGTVTILERPSRT